MVLLLAFLFCFSVLARVVTRSSRVHLGVFDACRFPACLGDSDVILTFISMLAFLAAML